MLPRLRAQLPSLRRALRRRRRLLAALVLAALAAALLPSLLPPSARGVEVVVTTTALPPGTVLREEHLGTTRLAAELVPEGTPREIQQVRGRTTLVPLGEGMPLLPGALESDGATTVPEGSALMSVPVPESLSGHLRPGTALELLPDAAGGPGGEGVPAQVVEVIAPAAESPALGGARTGSLEVLVLVDRARAREVAHALGGTGVVVAVIGYSPSRTASAAPPASSLSS